MDANPYTSCYPMWQQLTHKWRCNSFINPQIWP
jgi:hypothetical protein